MLRHFIFLFLIFISLRGFAQNNSFTYEDLKDLIQTSHITTIDELIPLLPMELRKNYTYIRKSMSLQDASNLYPRALLFSPDAKFLITFNGEPSQKGYNNLEIIQFRDSTRTFEFREIEMLQGRPANFSEANPQKCIQCHTGTSQLGLRPNWTSYSHWPGVYGEFDDRLYDSELSHYRKFLKTKSQGRYASLYMNPAQSVFPYSTEYKGNPNYRPNVRLTIALNRLEGIRMAQVIESPTFAPYKYGLLLTLANCPLSRADSLVLDEMIKTKRDTLPNFRFYPEVEQMDNLLYSLGIPPSDWSLAHIRNNSDVNQAFVDDSYIYYDGGSALHLFVAYQLAKNLKDRNPAFQDIQLPTSHPAMIDERGAFFDPEISKKVGYPIAGTKQAIDPRDFENIKTTDKNCNIISKVMQSRWPLEKEKTKSLPPFREPLFNSDEELAIAEKVNASGASLLAYTCSSCHLPYARGPELPFANPQQLKSQLESPGYRHGTLREEILFRLRTDDPKYAMPKGFDINSDTNKVRQILEAYIKGL